ncbi:hypothetical protein [Paraburkholderia hospita]|uniref:hypothetical protein n=1 Tax=Paraburkholderia hospita TaxID=169430 RepID=UPI003082E542
MQPAVARRAIQTIMREHQQLSAVVDGMTRFVDALDTDGRAPAPVMLRAMLYYIREYPEQVHHPKEGQVFIQALATAHE